MNATETNNEMTLAEAKTIARDATKAARAFLELSGFQNIKVMHKLSHNSFTGAFRFELAISGYASGEKISDRSREGKAVRAAIAAAQAEVHDTPIKFELFRAMPGRTWPS